MASDAADAWLRRVRRRLRPVPGHDARGSDVWPRGRDGYLGLGTSGSILPALRGAGPVLTHVTRRSVRCLLGHAPSLRPRWPVRPWVKLEAFLALGYMARAGALRALLDSGRAGDPVVGLYDLYQRTDGHALLRVAPRGPTVVRARGPATTPLPAAARGDAAPPQPDAGVGEVLPPTECLVYLGADPDEVVAHLASGRDLLLSEVSEAALRLGLQLYRAEALDHARRDWLPSLFELQEVAAVQWRGERLHISWGCAAPPACVPTGSADGHSVQGRPPRPLPRPVPRRQPAAVPGDPLADTTGPVRAAPPALGRFEERLARLWPAPALRSPPRLTARPAPAGPRALDSAAVDPFPAPAIFGRSHALCPGMTRGGPAGMVPAVATRSTDSEHGFFAHQEDFPRPGHSAAPGRGPTLAHGDTGPPASPGPALPGERRASCVALGLALSDAQPADPPGRACHLSPWAAASPLWTHTSATEMASCPG